jgi:cysteinyl-tRNA synthetase
MPKQTIKLYNTLHRKKEIFKPIKKDFVGIYSCGPTVYWYQHIGHMYAYTQWDILVRFLRYMGYKVKWVMNITDIGHLTSDEDEGEDKMEIAAKREKISVKELAEKYINQFLESMKELNISMPDVMPRATEHIEEQIELNKIIEKKGFTYQTKEGLIFDISKFPQYADFAKLKLEKQKETEKTRKEKKNKQDFHLWFSNKPEHILQWDSPWGRGFPGWHIECTAMSSKYLGENFDIHTGGKEHISIHHTNEVAQSHAAFGKQTANFWLHNGWLTLKDKKISKSDPETLILISHIKEKGFNPLSLRYLILNSHYRQGLNFTWQSLKASEISLNKIYSIAKEFKNSSSLEKKEKEEKELNDWNLKFQNNLSDDLNVSKALALTWQMLRSKKLKENQKLNLLLNWDNVFGFRIKEKIEEEIEIPENVKEILKKREIVRKNKNWKESDELRNEILKLGYVVEDTEEGQRIKLKE